MQPYFTISSFLILVACLAVGLGYAFLLYRKTDNLPRTLRYILAASRTIVVTIILWFIFSPLVRSITYTLEKPLILIAQDNSASIRLESKGFNSVQYRKNMEQLVSRLSEKYEVKPYSFGDKVTTGLDFSASGKVTDGEALINQFVDEYQNRNVGAIIMATDGIFNRGGNPVYALSRLHAPVYAIALGDTIPKKDRLIANVAYNELAYLDNDFTVEVQAQAFQSAGTVAQLRVSEGGKILHEESIAINSAVYVKEIPVKIHASSLGVKKYTVAISPGSNEVTVKNNVQDFFVEVIDGKQDVLIAADAPHPDIAVLRQAIEANKHYSVKIAYPEEFGELNLSKYGTVILYQLPSTQNIAKPLLDKLAGSTSSLWYIVGGKSNLSAFSAAQSYVQYTGNTSSLQEVFPAVNKNFTSFNVSDSDIGTLATYDPLLTPFGRIAVNGNAAVFLNQKIGKLETDNPLWFFMNNGGRKSAFLLGEGIWRWRLGETRAEDQSPVVDQLISKTIQYLSAKDDKRKFRVFSAKPKFDEHENIIINANLYNDAYVPVNTPDVSLKLTDERGKNFNYVFSKTETGYRIDLGNLPKGSYRYQGSTAYGGQPLTASGTFYVDEILTEYQQTTANHEILRAMAAQNGGSVYWPADLLKIVDALEKNDQLKTVSYEDRKYSPLIDQRWLFGLILILLAGEWFVRKRFGEM